MSPKYWWRYGDKRPELYASIADLDRVLVLTTVSKPVIPVFVSARQVLSKQLTIWTYDDDFHLGLLTSSFHWWWTITHGSTLETPDLLTQQRVAAGQSEVVGHGFAIIDARFSGRLRAEATS